MTGVLERRLDELYAIGALPEGGVFRPLYGDAWAAAGERVEHWMKQAGLKTRHDAVGNIWGRADGRGGEQSKSVVTGSHIDTVRHGGRLDGALGIVAGITAVESLLKTKGRPRQPLEVVAICEEEGSRFATSFWGSRAIVGDIETADDDIGQAMRERGFDPRRIATAARTDIDTFVELHIEQGAVLETSGMPVAIVSAIVGTAHLEVVVTGRPDHAGTTPMELRRDALAASAAMIHAIESLARSLGRPAVATVGRLRVEPDQINVVPGRAVFTVDLRHSNLSAREAIEARIRSLCSTIASERSLGVDIRILQQRSPVPMNREVRAVLAQAAKDCGVEAPEMDSGAGHDAQILAARCKVGMLFVPSIGGRSHCPEEATSPRHLELGTRVLARALELLAY
ncbi:MAG TPA: M20 family metallo-hydrolase [Gemmatimonadales bacterium]|nr:M20 family metallo-hydrolase [Gemmatimonadales bacterium]